MSVITIEGGKSEEKERCSSSVSNPVKESHQSKASTDFALAD